MLGKTLVKSGSSGVLNDGTPRKSTHLAGSWGCRSVVWKQEPAYGAQEAIERRCVGWWAGKPRPYISFALGWPNNIQ